MLSSKSNKWYMFICQYSENTKTSNRDLHLKLQQLSAVLEAAKSQIWFSAQCQLGSSFC